MFLTKSRRHFHWYVTHQNNLNIQWLKTYFSGYVWGTAAINWWCIGIVKNFSHVKYTGLWMEIRLVLKLILFSSQAWNEPGFLMNSIDKHQIRLLILCYFTSYFLQQVFFKIILVCIIIFNMFICFYNL